MGNQGSQWCVVEDHPGATYETMRLKAGDTVRFERRPTEWAGWVWCTDRRGIGGWVPEKWVSIEGDTCTAVRDYVSTELSVRKGDLLSVEETESGWAWAVNARNERGWVPLRCLERLPRDEVSDKE